MSPELYSDTPQVLSKSQAFLHWKAIFCLLSLSFRHHFHLASGPLPRASHRAQKSGLHLFPWAFLGHRGFCKCLRLWLPLQGLISPVCTIETLPQMVAKKTCLSDPLTLILWNADRCRGATQVCLGWDRRTQVPPREVESL